MPTHAGKQSHFAAEIFISSPPPTQGQIAGTQPPKAYNSGGSADKENTFKQPIRLDTRVRKGELRYKETTASKAASPKYSGLARHSPMPFFNVCIAILARFL